MSSGLLTQADGALSVLVSYFSDKLSWLTVQKVDERLKWQQEQHDNAAGGQDSQEAVLPQPVEGGSADTKMAGLPETEDDEDDDDEFL